jgi:hypothetical protein
MSSCRHAPAPPLRTPMVYVSVCFVRVRTPSASVEEPLLLARDAPRGRQPHATPQRLLLLRAAEEQVPFPKSHT